MYSNAMTPVFSTIEARKEFIGSLERKFYKFSDWYYDIMNHHNTMIELAKWHIHENWEKVDWKDFRIKINGTDYCNKEYKPTYRDSTLGKLFKEIYDKMQKFKRVSFVYDHTDGDLSIEIDGKWKFMSDEEVVSAVMYLEEKYGKD